MSHHLRIPVRAIGPCIASREHRYGGRNWFCHRFYRIQHAAVSAAIARIHSAKVQGLNGDISHPRELSINEFYMSQYFSMIDQVVILAQQFYIKTHISNIKNYIYDKQNGVSTT